jgi:hypothetical protein
MDASVFVPIVERIHQFLAKYEIEGSCAGVYSEKEWTDIRFEIYDTKLIKRINDWHQPELKEVVGNQYDVEISAPMPLPEQANIIRIRFYEISA